LSQTKCASSACNSSVAGYIGGGHTSGNVSTIEKQTFDTEISSIVAYLQLSRESLSSFNSSTYGYFAGGYGSNLLSSIERLDFTSNSIAMMTITLNQSSKYHCSCNNSTNGYITGFYNNCYFITTIDKYLFSNNSISTLAATLNTTRAWLAACQIGDFY